MCPLRFGGAPDEQDARRRFERLVSAGIGGSEIHLDEGSNLAEVVRVACAHAPYLATLAARDVRRLVLAAEDPYLRHEKPRVVMESELCRALEGVHDGRELALRLRAYRAREYIRLGARELGLGDRAEVGRELSYLADACLCAAIRFHDAELCAAVGEPLQVADDGTTRRAGLVVMGMGKLGGLELNFSSDIDVIFVYHSDQGSAGRLSLHEYFDKLAQRVVRAIGEVTEDDIIFRVDLRLRPEGTRGPLVNSLLSLERYYESFGRPWERQAWLKARPCAGDLSLGEETLSALEPFIYPRTLSGQVIRDVEDLNRRIKAELDPQRLGRGFDVKLGRGGIREVEFFVQALQLVHAGKRVGLRERNTRRALDKLLFAGLITDREWRALSDGYDFLRQVEHLLQLESGRQTHRLPTDFDSLTVLSKRLGCENAGELMSLLERRCGRIAEIFETLGGKTTIRKEIALLLSPSASSEDTVQALGMLGFRDTKEAAFQLELLRRKPASPLALAATPAAARLAPVFLEELCASPDPDLALRLAVDFVARLRGWEGLWTLFEENPPLLRLVASLLGTSAFLSVHFISHPELLDTLLLGGNGGPRRTREGLSRVVTERLREAEHEEVTWNLLRRIKTEEMLRIGLADVAGELDQDMVSAELSDLADECVKRTYEWVRMGLERRHGAIAPMTILALGKLGGRELGYASDLDLVFVYDGGIDDHFLMSKLAQRMVNALGAVMEEGRLYEVDTRLRPSGKQGMLVSSFAAWQKYHETAAQLWERQALIKARPVAGDQALSSQLAREIETQVYEGPKVSAPQIALGIARMRERIERELAREQGGRHDIKTGRGGLLDVEFAAQFLQLVHGPSHKDLRVRSTVQALERAAHLGIIDEPTRTTLVGGYKFLRQLENRMRIVHDRPIHELPADPIELDKLARRAGRPSASALERAYRAWTSDVRACYLKLLET
ncbi:MAG: bifunctional [glutamate--ammonia ligase]-adenylyl-L-tyrosine phosphorylase/[glutamate--ammonia-ligase] adenylyltransferase [Deltaproteobacteria bacterium]|nr:bifunctional [glutamate--ammonia ligase]-adenylyl-L-tyrosine phosphorylase/[glutamate--ammonia-ligase] adenylyltransferase [Deltaproteobacteria bacterium]